MLLPFSNKKIIIIRHAQSQAQQSPRHSRSSNYELLDAKLSDKGISQATSCNPPKDVELVVVSPLSRAIQTACTIFRGPEFNNMNFIVNPDAAEFPISPKMTGWENVGRVVHSIMHDDALIKLKRLKDLDFTLLEGYKEKYGYDWWSSEFEPEKVKAKILRLRRWLHDRPEKKIAVVGHCNALMNLIQTPFRIQNCSPIYCRLYLTFPSKNVRILRTDHPEIEYTLSILRRLVPRKRIKDKNRNGTVDKKKKEANKPTKVQVVPFNG